MSVKQKSVFDILCNYFELIQSQIDTSAEEFIMKSNLNDEKIKILNGFRQIMINKLQELKDQSYLNLKNSKWNLANLNMNDQELKRKIFMGKSIYFFANENLNILELNFGKLVILNFFSRMKNKKLNLRMK